MEHLKVTAGVGTWDCKRKLKLKGNRFEQRGEELRLPGLAGLPGIQRTVVCSGVGQSGAGPGLIGDVS